MQSDSVYVDILHLFGLFFYNILLWHDATFKEFTKSISYFPELFDETLSNIISLIL